MKILIVAATRSEVQPLIDKMDAMHDQEKEHLFCSYKNHHIYFIITGIGMVETTYYLTKALNTSYDIAINMGICGSFNTNLEIGTVVNVVEDCFSELGVEDGELFLLPSEINLVATTTISNTNFESPNTLIAILPKVNGITVNTVHGNDKSIDKVINKFHPIVESMEGAAFMYVCNKTKIPYLQVRAVSNIVEKRNREAWNIPVAISNLNNKVLEIINSY